MLCLINDKLESIKYVQRKTTRLILGVVLYSIRNKGIIGFIADDTVMFDYNKAKLFKRHKVSRCKIILQLKSIKYTCEK